MEHWNDLETGGNGNYVLNRARLYRDRRDFVIQTGDTGKPEALSGGVPHIQVVEEATVRGCTMNHET